MKQRDQWLWKTGRAMFLAAAFTMTAAVSVQAAAPAQVKITHGEASESSVVLKWNKVSHANVYKIYAKKGNGRTQLLTTRSAKKQTSVKIGHLTSNTDYTFYVSAVNSSGEEGKASSGKHLKLRMNTPGQVINVTLSKLKKTSVTVSWDKVPGANGYSVERLTSSGSFKRIARTSKRKITLTGLKTGKTYKISVRALRRKNGATAAGERSETVAIVPNSLSKAVASVAPFSRYSAGYKTDPSIVYPANVAETFANTRIPVGSGYKGKYLLWQNAYTMHLYVFKRSTPSAKWKFDRVYICASGARGGTSQRMMTVHGKGVRNATMWYLSYIEVGAIHSQLYHLDGKTLMSKGDLGHAVSHGCIRLRREAAYWVYKTIPGGTKLWVC